MSFADCLAEAVKGGELSDQDAKRLKRDFDAFRSKFAAGSPVTADAEAKRALAELLKNEATHKRRQARLALSSIKRIANDLNNHRDASGNVDLAGGALDLLENFGTARFPSVASRKSTIVGRAHARMETVLHHFRRGAIAGDKWRWNAADMPNVARELFGEDTGDTAAKGMAKAWEETSDWLRRRFNAAGGAIGKLDKWGLPQHHDARALRAKGLDAWKADILPRLDPARMTHPLTGKPVHPAELDGILDEIFETITTEGWNKVEPKRQAFGRGALANQRAEHRFLVFRDAANWLEYQKDYGGGGDVFASMMGHINMMARDIAAMEILGPNPSGTIEWLKQAVTKDAAGKRGKARDRAATINHRLEAVWGSIRGNLETPVNSKWASGFAGVRSIITASVLGSAAISAISDVGTSMIARRFAGIGGTRAMRDIVSSMRPATRREAVAAGLILDNAANVFHAQARYVGTLGGPEWASYLADRVLTVSGLTPWTQAGRHAFGLAFMRTGAENAGKSWDKLPDALRAIYARYGIKPAEWEQMRKLPLHDMGQGVTIMRPAEIAERINPVLAERYLGMIQTETEYAIPSGSHRSRTALLDQNQPGTLIGEVVRSFAQFKSFGAVFALLHGRRIAAELTANKWHGAGYAGALLLSTTLFGGVALQLKQIAAGRDPRDMEDAKFWGAALLQGGGLGIYGDFFFADINRYGGGFATTFAGPVIGRGNDLWTLTGGNVAQLLSGEKTHFGRELVKFARGNIPGSNIWYLKLAWEREVMDQLQFLVDPEANKAFKRRQQFWSRETGQDYFWAPGERLPERAPAFGG